MSAVLDYMHLCRLCLVKDKVNVSIFGETSDVQQLFLKISACLPVKVSQEDRLPKKICDSCVYKVDLLYQFWNTTVSAEKQLLEWCGGAAGDVNIKDGGGNGEDTLMLPQSHAHPHSIHTETILLKEERPDMVDTKLVDGHTELYAEEYELTYQQQQQLNTATASYNNTTTTTTTSSNKNTTNEQPRAQKRPRGRPPGSTKKKRQTTTKTRRSRGASVDDSGDDRLSDVEDLDSGTRGTRIAKEEAESDEDYLDNSESLEPTTFVGVPSTSACDELPGPSGIGTKSNTTSSNNSSATEPGKPAITNTTMKNRAAAVWPFNFVTVKVEKDTINPPPLDDKQPYVCEVCNDSFHKWTQLRTHKRKHMTKSVACPQCEKHFKTRYELNSHQRRVHATATLYYKCTLCDKQYHQPASLREHQRRHRRDFKVFCDQCGKGFFARSQLTRHTRVQHEGERYICFPCDKPFKDSRLLSVHMQQKHDPTYIPAEYTCDTCGKVYTSRDLYSRHVRRHKRGRAEYVCDLCGKVLTSSVSLRNHKFLHTGERPFQCSTCGKGFKSKGQLRTHTLIHTGERPYACTECEKRFTQRSTLVIHMRYHTGERPYACAICHKEFASRNLMKMHTKVHGTSLADM